MTARTNADPVTVARRAAAIKAKFADPAYRAEQAERMRLYNANLPDNVRQSRREHGKAKVPALRAAAANITAETRAENGRKRSATVLAWCPPEWRDKYRELKIRGRSAPAAKAIVLDLIAGRPMPTPYAVQKSKTAWCPPARRAEYNKLRSALGAAEARRVIEADLTPFERQLARVAAGAKLVATIRVRRPDPTMTLGGIASAML